MAQSLFDISYDQQIATIRDNYLKSEGVRSPIVSSADKDKLTVSIDELNAILIEEKASVTQLSNALGLSRTAVLSININSPLIPQSVRSEFNRIIQPLIQPYTIPANITIGDYLNLGEGLSQSLQNLQRNPISLPPSGQNVTFDPTNTTPPTGTTQPPPTQNIPEIRQPPITTSPSNTTQQQPERSNNTSTILAVGALIAGAALIANQVSNQEPDDIEIDEDDEDEFIENSEPDDIEGDEGEETFFEGDEGEFISEPPEVDQEPIFEGDEGEEFFTDQTDPGYVPAGSGKGLQGAKSNAQSQATAQDVANFQQREDWRVRLSLASNATYLYKDTTNALLKPLRDTDGIIFPYTPSISVQYMANYDQSVLTHSNYKIFQYTGSSVDSVTIGCDFTAQDTFEANYLMAVIHFLRSVTKMFYGQDQDPKPGVPPPLCYLTGLGAFQFDAHPLAITSFNYALPTDVDYIRAGTINSGAGVNRSPANTPNNSQVTSTNRLGPNLQPGGIGRAAVFQSEPAGTTEPTYVPTKMNIQIQAIPIVSRNDISNNFSLKKYATGELLRGTRRKAGGIW